MAQKVSSAPSKTGGEVEIKITSIDGLKLVEYLNPVEGSEASTTKWRFLQPTFLSRQLLCDISSEQEIKRLK